MSWTDIFINKREETILKTYGKINFLVRFFMDKGFDIANRTPYCITKEDIEDLINRCEQVLEDNSKAYKLLPTMDDFFFGNISSDEHYFKEVAQVLKHCKEIYLPAINQLKDNENIYFEI